MYFQQLPLMSYPDIENPIQRIALVNILTRISFLSEIVDNTAVYYDYQIKDGETAEIIADKLYNDPNRHWIILLFNKIMNPFYEFPLSDDILIELITTKYAQSIENSLTTIHHYERRITSKVLFNETEQSSASYKYIISDKELNFVTGILEPTPQLPGVDSYISLGSTTESFGGGITVNTEQVNWAISNNAYERDENEKRRNIKLLDKNYVVGVENEFRRLMRDGS